ncbi:MAG: FHA domain-containing protein [Planctomycetes bacterium]|nr:FHA domain-containing protein [Planctomycetota bacterium]
MTDFDPTSSQALELTEGWLSIQRHDGTHEHVRLSLALTTIGRSEQSVLEMLDPKLSRFHCEIERYADGYRVRDCNSRNGTMLNGEPVRGAQLLDEGDQVKIGRTIMTFLRARPDEVRSDAVVKITPLASPPEDEDLDDDGPTTPHMAQRRPTRGHYDTRNTQAVESLNVRNKNPWKILADASRAILGAKHRRALLDATVEHARSFFESHGALVALGSHVDQLSVTASLGVEEEFADRCRAVAARAVTTRSAVVEDRRAIGMPLIAGEEVIGALVLHDLSGTPDEGGKEIEAFETFADVVAHTLTTSLRVEEVRREERGAGARRIAEDLRGVLKPSEVGEVKGLEIARATTRGEDVARAFQDHLRAPARAGREELYLVLGDVPDPGAAPVRRLRRSGERAFVSLLGQAELRGALRALVEVLPRTSDLLAQLDGALRREASVERAALLIARYDTVGETFRFAGAGHGPVLVRRANGEMETFAPTCGPLGGEEVIRPAEIEIALRRDDQILFATRGALELEESGREELSSLFVRLGGPAHEVDVVAQRVAEALVDQSSLTGPAGFTLLLLRKT